MVSVQTIYDVLLLYILLCLTVIFVCSASNNPDLWATNLAILLLFATVYVCLSRTPMPRGENEDLGYLFFVPVIALVISLVLYRMFIR